MFKVLSIIAAVVLIAFGAYYYFELRGPDYETSDIPAVSFEDISENVDEIEDTQEDIAEDLEEIDETEEVEQGIPEETDVLGEGNGIPEQINLAVPFTSQAPQANWSLPYQEACEEASAYMVSEYYAGTSAGKIDPDVADAAILDLVAFEEDFLGTYLDTTAVETVQFIDAYYGLNATVVENPTVDQIKAEIAAGRPVIVPAAGRELGNPNFTGEGPLYHMLVIKGYTANSFITNDPGTRNGENYVYNIQTIMDAMGDWNNGDPAHGAKVVIFVSK